MNTTHPLVLEKQRFLDLARNFTSLTEAETRELDVLQKEFPYSQVIHNLVSRGAQDNHFATSKSLLNISAVYSTDRVVLKNIITAPRVNRTTAVDELAEIEPVPVKQVVEKETTDATIEAKDKSSTVPDEHLDADSLADTIMADIKRLQELKHNFELSVEAFEHSKGAPSKPDKGHSEPRPKKGGNKDKDSSEPGEGLLEEIKSKKKLVPESPKQKEQIDLIDQFIKKQPSIPKPQPTVDASDLAEKSLALTDNIVSETLVEILLKQGKKDKAIEVLKKLIWKFPQKKAIFAAQIEELKK